MSLPRHDPPGFVNDLTEENKQGWSEVISSFMLTTWVTPTLTPQFYDGAKVAEKQPVADQKITWIAFPKQVKLANPNDRKRWTIADSDRKFQDEYCEWSIKRDVNGKMLKIVFCNEGPEYYQYLAAVQPETLVSLYQTLNPGYSIQSQDLFINQGGQQVYNPLNKWNSSTTTGSIMHLIQPANTLGAEVDLGAIASVLRKDANGNPITNSDQLCKCSFYGNPNRNSDPTIGAGINAIARTGAMLTIKNPIGLYIDEMNWGQVETPDGTDPSEFWKWTRGSEGFWMRAEFEVPAGKGYVLGDLTVNGVPLEFGGQLADFLRISLTGHAMDTKGGHQIPPRICGDAPRHNPNNPPAPPEAVAAPVPGASAPAEEHAKHHHHHQHHSHMVKKFAGLSNHTIQRFHADHYEECFD